MIFRGTGVFFDGIEAVFSLSKLMDLFLAGNHTVFRTWRVLESSWTSLSGSEDLPASR